MRKQVFSSGARRTERNGSDSTHQNSASPYQRTPKKLKLQMTTRKIVIHTATLIESFQNWMTRAAAVISYGNKGQRICGFSRRVSRRTVGSVIAYEYQ